MWIAIILMKFSLEFRQSIIILVFSLGINNLLKALLKLLQRSIIENKALKCVVIH
jgi:hypothetical protein